MPEVIRDTKAMLAQMKPVLGAEEFVFCTTRDGEIIARARFLALCLFEEEEGTTLIFIYPKNVTGNADQRAREAKRLFPEAGVGAITSPSI